MRNIVIKILSAAKKGKSEFKVKRGMRNYHTNLEKKRENGRKIANPKIFINLKLFA